MVLSHSTISAPDSVVKGFLRGGAAGALVAGAIIQLILRVGVD
jgi:hypothetical protein